MQTKKIVKTVEKKTRTAGKEVKTTEKEQKSAEKGAKTKNAPKGEKAVKVAKVELKEPEIEVKNITRAEYYTLKSRVIDLEKENNSRVYFFKSFGSGDYWSAINNSAQFYKNVIAPQIKRECNWRDDTDHKLRVQEIISIKDINLLHIAITERGFKCDNRSNNTMRCYYLKNKVTDALLNAWRNSDEMRWHMAEKLVYPARRWVDMRQALFALTRSTQPMVNKMDSKTYGDYGSHMKQCLLGIMKRIN